MDKRAKSKSGFTIIETVLFLALMGLIFLGAVIGTNGSISQQRYRDAVEQFVSDLKDIQSQAENIEIQDRDGTTYCKVATVEGDTPETWTAHNIGGTIGVTPIFKNRIMDSELRRGRSNCAQYGAVTQVVANGADSKIYSYGLKGSDARLIKENNVNKNQETDARYLKHAMVYADYDNGFSERNMLWGTEVEVLCDGSEYLNSLVGCDSGKSFSGVSIIVMTYRSPITGNMKNVLKLWKNTEEDQPDIQGQEYSRILNSSTRSYINDGVWHFLDNMPGDGGLPQNSGFYMKSARFCINAGNGMTYENGGRRMVEITSGDAGTGSIHLYEADDSENKCNE